MAHRNSLIIAVATLTAAVSFLAPGSGPAMAGGGASGTAVQILRHALTATIQGHSAHLAGLARLTDTAHTKGLKFSVGGNVVFTGDVSGGPISSLHLRGQYRLLNQSRSFKIRSRGLVSATKIGKEPWHCSRATATTASLATGGPASGMGLRTLRRWLRTLARKAKLAIAGASMIGGIPVWDIRLTFRHRLNPAALIRIGTPTPAGLPSGLSRFVPPHPWVNLDANVWVSQLRYTLQRLSLDLLVHERTNTIGLHFELALSRYGERLKIRIPCNVAA